VKQLLLLRHAEAEPARPGLSDFDRTLTPQGHAQAQAAARRLRQFGVHLDALLASPAARARQTAVIVAAQLHLDAVLLYEPALYLGAAATVLQPLQHCSAAARAVLVVGHNPALSELARELAGNPPGDEHRFVLATGDLCRIEFEADSWSTLAPAAVRAVTMAR